MNLLISLTLALFSFGDLAQARHRNPVQDPPPVGGAPYNQCNPWKKDYSVSCADLQGNRVSFIWRRNGCQTIFDETVLCSFENPESFENFCSDWEEVSDVSCSEVSGRLGTQLRRVCTLTFLNTTSCTE